MDKKAVSLLLISCLYCLVQASNLPAGVQKCSIEDEKCLLESMNNVLRNYAKTGSKELALVPLDPLRVKKFRLGKNPNSPVSIDLTFTNAEFLGLGHSQITKISPFSREDIHIELVSPRLVLKGPYKVEGRVLILPIQGAGEAIITLDNCRVRAILKQHPVSKGPHQTYAQVSEVKLRLEPAHVTYKLEGLFNGQKAPSDAFHTLANENWKEIFDELHDDIAVATGLIFKAILNQSLGKTPVEQLFSN